MASLGSFEVIDNLVGSTNTTNQQSVAMFVSSSRLNMFFTPKGVMEPVFDPALPNNYATNDSVLAALFVSASRLKMFFTPKGPFDGLFVSTGLPDLQEIILTKFSWGK